MKFIKEAIEVKHPGIGVFCVVRTKRYDSKLSAYLEMLDEARKDFPGLKAVDVEAVIYGGEYFKGTRGIEFVIRNQPIPECYKKVRWIEPRL
jgi:hypothetical protein